MIFLLEGINVRIRFQQKPGQPPALLTVKQQIGEINISHC